MCQGPGNIKRSGIDKECFSMASFHCAWEASRKSQPRRPPEWHSLHHAAKAWVHIPPLSLTALCLCSPAIKEWEQCLLGTLGGLSRFSHAILEVACGKLGILSWRDWILKWIGINSVSVASSALTVTWAICAMFCMEHVSLQMQLCIIIPATKQKAIVKAVKKKKWWHLILSLEENCTFVE